ncbi:Sucraseferredoxin-like protein, partial [Coemansia spiralis]
IFVCTHGSRDYLCGLHGGKLLEDLRALISERNMGKHVAAWSTSHIGGHKFAANAIVYPRGDWYGT